MLGLLAGLMRADLTMTEGAPAGPASAARAATKRRCNS
jgi:hypothetical protein